MTPQELFDKWRVEVDTDSITYDEHTGEMVVRESGVIKFTEWLVEEINKEPDEITEWKIRRKAFIKNHPNANIDEVEPRVYRFKYLEDSQNED